MDILDFFNGLLDFHVVFLNIFWIFEPFNLFEFFVHYLDSFQSYLRLLLKATNVDTKNDLKWVKTA